MGSCLFDEYKYKKMCLRPQFECKRAGNLADLERITIPSKESLEEFRHLKCRRAKYFLKKDK